MKMKIKFAVLLSLVLTINIMLVGCSNSTTAKKSSDVKQITIGFVPMTLDNPFFITMANGAKEEAKKLGVKLNVQAASSHADANAQLTIVQNMISSGVNAICIDPSSSVGLATALQSCKAAKISVINLDTRLDASIVKQVGLDVPFFGTNNVAGAKLAGDYVVKNMPKGTKTAILTGIAGQQNTADRLNGFIDATKGYINVVAQQTANWDVNQGYTTMQNMLSAHPDITLLFSCNDDMAIGALRAITDAGKQNQIKVIGFDGTSQCLNNVKSGTMIADVAQDPAKMGILGVDNAVKMAKGEKVEMSIDTGEKLIIKDNVDAQILYNAKYSAK